MNKQQSLIFFSSIFQESEKITEMEAWLLGMEGDKLGAYHENFDEAIDKLEVILDGTKKNEKHLALNTLGRSHW